MANWSPILTVVGALLPGGSVGLRCAPSVAKRLVLAVGLLGLGPASLSPSSARLFAQEGGKATHAKLVELVGWKYIPPKGADGQQILELKLNVHPDIPTGAKLSFELEYQGLPVKGAADFVLKDKRRKGALFFWKQRERVPADTYYLRVRMYLVDQAPGVREEILKKPKSFPPEADPWGLYFFKQPIQVGTEEELLAEKLAACKAYEDLCYALVDQMVAFTKLTDAVKAGEKAVQGGQLDVPKFTEILIAWRKEQGELQKTILRFPEDHLAFFQKFRTAHLNLQQLGQMVSKHSWALQNEVTKQYGVVTINPVSHPSFDQGFRYRVSTEALTNKLNQILDLVCPPPPEEDVEPEAETAEAAKKPKEPKKTSKKSKKKAKKS